MGSSLSVLKRAYAPLVEVFLERLGAPERYRGMPAPFLPLVGSHFDTTNYRVAFTGMETGGWRSLVRFIREGRNNPTDVFDEPQRNFEQMKFLKWLNNFHTSFFDFILQFLASINSVTDWRTLLDRNHDEILGSFAWMNARAIERYDVSAKGNSVSRRIWSEVRESSSVFDAASHALKALQPRLLVILNWQRAEEWLTKDFAGWVGPDEVDDHLWYYFLIETKTHVLWTCHPRWIASNIGFKRQIAKMAQTITEKNVFC